MMAVPLMLVIAVMARRGVIQWDFLACALVPLILPILWLASIRLEITERDFAYRNLLRRSGLAFRQISKVGYKKVHGKGMDFAWLVIHTRNGQPISFNPKPFPLGVIAALFDAFDQHGIPIEAATFWHARYLEKQIRDYRARLGRAPDERR